MAALKRWTWERRVGVIRKVLDALRYAHARGIVHRDIKPANILVGAMDEVFVLDWGIARRQRTDDTRPGAAVGIPDSALKTMLGAIIGTPHYMAPEQARGEAADVRSDLYSLALTLWEFLTLEHPFAKLENVAQVLEAQIKEPIPLASFLRSPHQPPVPMDLTWFLQKALRKDPAERFQTAEEMLNRLDDRAMGKVPIQCHVTATKRLSYEFIQLVSRWPLVFAIAIVGTLAGLGWLVFR